MKRQNTAVKLRPRKNRQGQIIGYYLEWNINGTRTRRAIQGLKPYPNPRTPKERAENRQILCTAQLRCDEANAEYRKSTHGLIIGDQHAEGKTLLSDYLMQVAKEREVKAATFANYQCAQNFVKLCDTPLQKISPQWVKEFVQLLRERIAAESSQNIYLTKVKTAIASAVKRGIIPRNPFDSIEAKCPKPKRPKR